MLTQFKAHRGNVANAAQRYDDLYRTWLAQAENADKTFADFTEWLKSVKDDTAGAAPDFVARLILAMS
ncbi:hypothetical protein [Neisseria perflava]|uniref:hypothetical protein n=1 Tax=Neisseria perflava TaxID=33053 RepID=UPI00209F86D9|nr:hypothetical protein [Neisseria perflava]MCP1659353.1 hypothetical protein [Neisseria perflava]